MASEGTSSLDPTDWIREKKKEKREGKKERVLEREGSTFSLNFPTIDPSNPGETRQS